MAEVAARDAAARANRRFFQGLGVVTLAAVVWGLVLGPFALTSYVAGRLNLAFVDVALLEVCGRGMLIVLAGLMVVSRWVVKQRLRAVYWLAMLAGLIAPGVLLLVPVGRPLIEWYTVGFERYVERRADVETIQAWVSMVDPNDFGGLVSSRREHNLTPAERPPELARLGDAATVELDAAGRPMVRLEWHHGKGGTNGVAIGREDMPTPPSEHTMYGERRYELRPGVYFWFRER
jgi:hypothetical protein